MFLLNFRYQGGIRAHWAMTIKDILDYFETHIEDVTWPYLILHGEKDALCDPEGSKYFYDTSKSQDKKIKVKYFKNIVVK